MKGVMMKFETIKQYFPIFLILISFSISSNAESEIQTEDQKEQKSNREPNSMRKAKYCFQNVNSKGFRESCYSTAKLCNERKRFWSEVDKLDTQNCKVLFE